MAIVVAVACLSVMSLCAGQDAQASIRKSTNIPAQELAPALKTLARERGFQVVFRSEVVGTKRTQGAVGELTTTEALTRLLQGTNLTYSYLDANTVTILPADPASKPMAQGPSTVSYSQETRLPETKVAGAEGGPVRNSAGESSPGEDSTTGQGLAEVVVTAQKRAEPLQRVPTAVSAFTSDTLENAHIDDISGLQGLVPSLTITRAGGSSNTPQISMRGISLQDIEKTVESGIGFNVDGVPLGSTTGALLGAFDVDRIEVLRGPQGTLFGKNTVGGTINVIRSRPDTDGDFTAKFRVTTGSADRNDYEGVVMSPLIQGKLAGKVAFSLQNDDGLYTNTVFPGSAGETGKRDFKDFVVALNATPIDGLAWLVTLERQDDASQPVPYIPIDTPNVVQLGIPGYFGGKNIECTNPFLAASCPPLSIDRNTVETPNLPQSYLLNALTSELSYNAGPMKYVSVTGYRQTNENGYFDFDATQFALTETRRRQTQEQVSQELRAESQFEGPFDFVAGAFYFYGRESNLQTNSLDRAALAPVAPGVTYLNSTNSFHYVYYSWSEALFAQGNYKILPKLKLTVGLRKTWDRKSINFETFSALPPSSIRDPSVIGPVASATNQTANFGKFTPKYGLEYQVTPDVLTYVSYAVGYNTGGFNGRAPSAAFVGPFQPEIMYAYEVGLKSEWFDHRLRANVAAYHNTMKDKQESVLILGPGVFGTTTVNAARARYDGVDLELAYAPIRGLTLTATTGWLDARYLQFSGNLGQGYVADLTGLELRRAPHWTAGYMSDYAFQAGPGRMGFNVAVQYVDDYQNNVLNDPRGVTPPTTKVDLSARYEFPFRKFQFEVNAFVKDVNDEHAYTGMTSGNTVGTFVDFAIPDPGRTWGLSFTAKY